MRGSRNSAARAAKVPCGDQRNMLERTLSCWRVSMRSERDFNCSDSSEGLCMGLGPVTESGRVGAESNGNCVNQTGTMCKISRGRV